MIVQLLQRLADRAEIAFLPNPYFDRATVLESILLSFGLDATTSSSQNHRSFYEFLTRSHKAGKTCVLVFDEAQELDRGTLEAIRMLSNFETPTQKLVQIILAGQPRLAETLKQPECKQIRERLSGIARLRPLTESEVRDYVAHRLRMAGSSINLFTSNALDAVASASSGVPRNINNICFNSLTLAFALKHRRVGREEVAEVLRDLDLKLNDAPAIDGGSELAQTALPESTVTLPRGGASLRIRVRCGSGWRPLLRIWQQLHL